LNTDGRAAGEQVYGLRFSRSELRVERIAFVYYLWLFSFRGVSELFSWSELYLPAPVLIVLTVLRVS
jgi:hypothetical protein